MYKLPLLSHWNTKQFSQISSAYSLPWYSSNQSVDCSVIKSHKPISIVSTQYEAIFANNDFWWNPNLKKKDGSYENKSNPLGLLDPWIGAGKRFNEGLKLDYRDPPLCVFVSNNEYPKLRWGDWDLYDLPVCEDKIRAISVGYKEKVRAMIGEIRAKCNFPTVFLGYNAFYPSFVGRWSGWTKYATGSEWGWDGPSLPYYTNPWDGCTDCNVWSVQIEAMNWAYFLKDRPKWVEMSVWDGNEAKTLANKTSKMDQYVRAGQVWSNQRYIGAIKFGMWLLRPDSIREFKPHTEPLSIDQFDLIKDSIKELETYQEFWENGELLLGQREHPYQHIDIKGRWFMLENSTLGPLKKLHEIIPVYSLGVKLGNQVLVYAHSPLGPTKATIHLSQSKQITVDVPIEGAYWIESV